MPLARTSAKPAPREDASPYKSRYNLRKTKASNDAPDTTDNNHANTSRAAATNSGAPQAKVPRERCTKEQTAALEALYNLYEGAPTPEQMEELAARIHKSYNSTQVWFRNQRAKKQKATAGRKTIVSATFDPGTDTTSSNDALMVEDTTPEQPEQPVQPLAAPLPQPQKAKKPRGRAARLRNVQAAFKRPIHANKQRAAEPSFMLTCSSSPGIDDVPTNKPSTFNHRQASGDSNGSVSQTPERTSARTGVVVLWGLTELEHALKEYPVNVQITARTMTKMRAMTQNPHTVAGKILSDSPGLYEPWAFPFPSASNRRMTRLRSQKGDVGQWLENGEEKIYRVFPHMVPESWMAGPSNNGKGRHP